MTAVPEPMNTIAALIDKVYESKQEEPRPHLGASLLGHPCDRWLWLSFRWAVRERFSGRVLRLFRRGKLEEKQIMEDLRSIGVVFRECEEGQWQVDFGCHVSGSLDGVIDHGVPEAPKKLHVLEIKTHSLKSFNGLESKGVKEDKPQHWCQMQTYMHGMGIDRALYVAVCKDDDRYYTERVRYDREAAEKLIGRGQRIALSDRLPEPLSVDPSWYQCRFCAAHTFCHDTHLTQEICCRTCAHATATRASTWTCARYGNAEIPIEAQREGCDCHVLHPDLVPWKWLDSDDPWTAVYEIDGQAVRNGEADGNVIGSREIVDWTWKVQDESFGPFEEVEECPSEIINSEPSTTSIAGSRGTGDTRA
jgi:hypothetical protein